MEMICRGGCPVSGFGLGSDRDDVHAVQRAISDAQSAAAAATDKFDRTKLDKWSQDKWADLSHRATTFVTTDVPLFTGIDEMYTSGKSILQELSAWQDKIKGAPAPAPAARPRPAPVALPKRAPPPVSDASKPPEPSDGDKSNTLTYVVVGGVLAAAAAATVAIVSLRPRRLAAAG